MSVQTLTTVGFGDVYPATQGGRAFAQRGEWSWMGFPLVMVLFHEDFIIEMGKGWLVDDYMGFITLHELGNRS
jgi:hypothetical protein